MPEIEPLTASTPTGEIPVNYKEVIYFIESPSPADLLRGRNEGDALARVLSLGDLNVVYYLCVSLDSIDIAIGDIADKILNQEDYDTAFPFIHVSAHGSEDGIELTDGDLLLWDQLTNRLNTINDAVGYISLPPTLNQKIPKISLSLSSCSAYKNYIEQSPNNSAYQCIVGPTDDVSWCQSLIAFSTFYYRGLIKGGSYDPAITAMNMAAGFDKEPDFIFRLHNPHPFENQEP